MVSLDLGAIGTARSDSQGCPDGFAMCAKSEKPHARIIWDSAWATDGSFFATASRDKTVKIWRTGEDWACLASLKFEESATAITLTQHHESVPLFVSLSAAS